MTQHNSNLWPIIESIGTALSAGVVCAGSWWGLVRRRIKRQLESVTFSDLGVAIERSELRQNERVEARHRETNLRLDTQDATLAKIEKLLEDQIKPRHAMQTAVQSLWADMITIRRQLNIPDAPRLDLHDNKS